MNCEAGVERGASAVMQRASASVTLLHSRRRAAFCVAMYPGCVPIQNIAGARPARHRPDTCRRFNVSMPHRTRGSPKTRVRGPLTALQGP
jgi:hypothetical protein